MLAQPGRRDVIGKINGRAAGNIGDPTARLRSIKPTNAGAVTPVGLYWSFVILCSTFGQR